MAEVRFALKIVFCYCALLCLTGNFACSAMPCSHLLRVFYAVFWAF